MGTLTLKRVPFRRARRQLETIRRAKGDRKIFQDIFLDCSVKFHCAVENLTQIMLRKKKRKKPASG